jgi:hypothetical protein
MDSKVFYKYRPADDFTIALLEKQEIKFSLAEEYNDPFDSKLIINVDSDPDRILQRLEDTPIDESKKQNIRKRIKSGEINSDEYMKAAYQAAKRTIMSSCFAGNSENILLWSHYADSHKGICVGIRDYSGTHIPGIKFNVKSCCTTPNGPYAEGIFPIYKVNYSDSGIVEFNPFKDDIKVYIDAHKNKAECWNYEDEYRLIIPRCEFKTNILPFDPRFVVEIYLGCCIEAGYCKKVQQIIKANYLDMRIAVKVFQMVPSKKRFVLEKKAMVIQ